jgi:matrix metalloproteinase-11 (stromelysin 3)
MRFDLDEAWAKNPGGGRIGLLHVACHEFGHLIGLEHSQTPGQLMNPFYTPRISRPQAEDAARAKKYYGPARETPSAPSPGAPSPDNPQPPGGPLSVSQLEILLRVNGDDKLVIGPQSIDLSKRKLRLVAEE